MPQILSPAVLSRITPVLRGCAAATGLLMLAGCYVEPAPPPPVAYYAPAPAYYAYPPYRYYGAPYYAGPAVGVGIHIR